MQPHEFFTRHLYIYLLTNSCWSGVGARKEMKETCDYNYQRPGPPSITLDIGLNLSNSDGTESVHYCLRLARRGQLMF